MAKGNYNKTGFYAGADYGFDPNYGKEFSLDLPSEYRFSAGEFGFPSDPTTANQLVAVSKKLNTGAKTIEVSGINILGGGPGGLMEKIPDQHLKEINRLKQLTGVDLTFHGPIIEASGWGEGGWNEIARKGAERQMWSAVDRAHVLEPNGNLVVTFHSTAALPDMIQKEMTKNGEKVVEIIAFDERDPRGPTRIRPKENILLNEKADAYKELENINKQTWFNQMAQLSFNTRRGLEAVEDPLEKMRKKEEEGLNTNEILDLYHKSKTDKNWMDIYNKLNPEAQKVAKELINKANFGEMHLRESYSGFQEQFNKAWVAAERSGESGKEDLQRLSRYRDEFLETKKKIDFDSPQDLERLGEEIQKGINVLSSLKHTPQFLRPMNDFIIDKSSETFGNIAFNAYKKYKNKSPIISIENPPAGGGISRAEDLKKLVDEARKKFEKQAVEELGMDSSEAKKQAEKLIGVTWDVGHINMLRKHGYENEHLEKQTETVAKMVKHIHLSDNFGYEHTELPMGMGNVPMKGHLEALKKYGVQLNKIKKIVETGDWFSRQGLGLQSTPFTETLAAFGSPIYPMRMTPYWTQARGSAGGYFAGYGRFLPEQHFNLYGSGFSNLPPELGGQMAGRSRVSGNPIE